MVATSLFIISENKETSKMNHSNKVSSTSHYYSDNEEVTVPSTPTKKHKMDSSTFDFESRSLPNTPKASHTSSISKEEWSFYTMAPVRPSKKRGLYMSDDECLRTAPQLPFLGGNNVTDNDSININLSPIALRRLIPSFRIYADVMESAPQLPYLPVDDDDNNNLKENTPPTFHQLKSYTPREMNNNNNNMSSSNSRDVLSHLRFN